MRLLRIVAAYRRTRRNDLMLGAILAFVAGAMNAGGFLAIGTYTSHMTGIISSIADNLALGVFGLVGSGVALLTGFTLGAASSAILINWARRHARRQQYAYPLALESGLLIAFAGLGAVLPEGSVAPVTALLLCFVMGLQNATITKISGARIRTTHLTGMITDIGIELGKLTYGVMARLLNHPPLPRDGRKLAILCRSLACSSSADWWARWASTSRSCLLPAARRPASRGRFAATAPAPASRIATLSRVTSVDRPSQARDPRNGTVSRNFS